MKIAILGGGFTGLTAAFYLQKKGHEVIVYEKQQDLGGLAAGFKADGWDWFLERAYHHIFSNDSDIIDFVKETGADSVFLTSPETSSLYAMPNGDLKIFPLDTPQDLLTFPILSPVERIRAGMALGIFKLSPYLKLYEENTAAQLLKNWMGANAYETLFGELFRKKFGKYAENILATFFWARIKKRSKQLGYMEGGFQIFINYLEQLLKDNGIAVEKGVTVKTIRKIDNTFGVELDREGETESVVFDKVISTLPTPVIAKIGEELLPQEYISNLKKIKYLNAACLIVESDKKLLDHAYWLSVCVKDMPMMVAVQHTNMIDKEHYGGKHILYLANYIDNDHELLKMTAEEALEYYKPALKRINPIFHKSITRTFYFKAPFAQPIFDKEFVKVKPDFITPVDGFFMANLDMTYPYDRGTNFAVKLGKDVSAFIPEE